MKFLTSEDYKFVAAGVWEGVDGGGCIPSPFPKKIPQLSTATEL